MWGDDNVIQVWTDGSCSLKQGSGGWSFYVEHGTKSALRYGFANNTTVNVMELTAILRALQFVRMTPPYPMVVYTDSQYSLKAIKEWPHVWEKRNWKNAIGEPVKNAELIRECITWFHHHQKARRVDIRWLAGHAGHLNNERVDAAASMARQMKKTNWRW